MISFLVGFYLGGASVDFITNIFLGLTLREAGFAAVIWPWTSTKSVIRLARR